jgi:hypothetical protein
MVSSFYHILFQENAQVDIKYFGTIYLSIYKKKKKSLKFLPSGRDPRMHIAFPLWMARPIFRAKNAIYLVDIYFDEYNGH